MCAHNYVATLHTMAIILQNFIATTENNRDFSVSSFLFAILSRLLAVQYNILIGMSVQLQSEVNSHTA